MSLAWKPKPLTDEELEERYQEWIRSGGQHGPLEPERASMRLIGLVIVLGSFSGVVYLLWYIVHR
jgi:hypothetical protein